MHTRMLDVGKENKDSLPDDESYDLVIGLLFKANQTDAAFKFVDFVLTSGYTMSSNVFNQCIRRCLDNNRLDTLLSIIEKCKVHLLLHIILSTLSCWITDYF